MRRTALLAAAFSIVALCNLAEARAAGPFRTVMAQTGFSADQIRENSYLTAIAYAHLKTTQFEQRNAKKVLGGAFPAGDAILGPDATPDDHKSFQKSLERIDLRGFGPAVFDDAAISSGDETVFSAWSECMAARGGPTVWFETVDAKTAMLHIQAGAGRADRLSDNIALLPGFTVRAGDECLDGGRPITAKGCAATITATKHTLPLALVVNTEQSTARAYWPPRIRLTTDLEKYQAPLVVRAQIATAASPEDLQRRVFLMRPSLAKQGWRFRPSSVVLSKPEKARGPFGDCLRGGLHISDTFIAVTYGFSNKIDALLVCKWTITAEVYRTKVEPID